MAPVGHGVDEGASRGGAPVGEVEDVSRPEVAVQAGAGNVGGGDKGGLRRIEVAACHARRDLFEQMRLMRAK